jgi:hypothetical protein
MGIDETEDVENKGRTVPTVLVLGDVDRSEMRDLWGWLKQLIGEKAKWVVSPTVASLFSRPAVDEFPDLIIVFQSWSQEFSLQEVHQLMAFAPLARLVVCYGAWCESDGRNHSQWPPSVRVAVWGAQNRIEREWRLIQFPGETPPLPWSASREEVFAADNSTFTRSDLSRRILVDSPDPAYRGFLIEQVCAMGHILVSENPSVLIFDADPWGLSRMAMPQELTDRYPTATVFAVASLVQPPLKEDLAGFGVQTVMPKLEMSWDI